MKKHYQNLNPFSSVLALFFIMILIVSLNPVIFAQTSQPASSQVVTVGIESTTIFSLFPGFWTQTNASFDNIVIGSLYSSLSHFHVMPYLLFSINDLTLKIMLNYWENDDFILLSPFKSPEYLSISANLIYNHDFFDFAIHQVLFFSKNPGDITSGAVLTNATFELEDFYLIIKNLFSVLDITLGYSGSYFSNPLFRSTGVQSAKNDTLFDPLSNNLYTLFLSVENSTKGTFVGWNFVGVNQQNYIGLLLTAKLFGFRLNLDFSLPYSQNKNNQSISFQDYFEQGFFKVHLNYTNESIGSFNLYFQPYIANDNYYSTGVMLVTYYAEKGEDLSKYFISFDYTPSLPFLKDLILVISFDGWFDKIQDQRNSSQTGSGSVTDPYVLSFVNANRFSIGFDGRYDLNSILKGLSIDALFLYFITSETSYQVTNAAGTTWTDNISNLESNTNNLVMSSYTEANYMLYNFFGITNPYRLKGFIGINFQFSSFITGIGFEYIKTYGDVQDYFDPTISAAEFAGRTDPKTPYGYFDRINIILKGFCKIESNLLFGIQFNFLFYPGFPTASELGYASFTQTNSTVVSAEDQYNLDKINLPSYQINFVFQIIF